METITSKKNPLIVQTKKVKDNPNGKLFLESPKLIEEAYLINVGFDYVIICDEKQKEFEEKYPFLFKFKFFLITRNVLEHLCETKTPQGVVAVVNFSPSPAVKPVENFLVLENLQDPGNLGTIIRSASGTSFKDIFLINCASIYNQKVLRATMGNIFKVNLHTLASSKDFLEFAKVNNLRLFRADMTGKNLFEMTKPANNFGVVIGNEGSGLSDFLKSNIEKTIKIPMKNDLESLNAAVSCAIIIYFLDNIR